MAFMALSLSDSNCINSFLISIASFANLSFLPSNIVTSLTLTCLIVSKAQTFEFKSSLAIFNSEFKSSFFSTGK